MKRLYVLRHAKSSWADSMLRDFDRPLNKRGKRDAPLMANLVKRLYGEPEVLIASPANRAYTTAQVFANEFALGGHALLSEPRLYESGIREYLQVLEETDGGLASVMLVGHNPTVTELAEYLSDLSVDNMPTCAIAVIEFDTDSWEDMTDMQGTCIGYEYPKKYNISQGLQ